jgi:LPS export ABC transporter protein LptC
MDNLPSRLPLVFVAVVFMVVSCSSKPEKLAIEADTDDRKIDGVGEAAAISQKLQGVKYSESKDGRLQWELVAESVRQADDGPTHLQDVEITYYSDDGKVTVLTADSGWYQSVERNALLRGNVVVRTFEGDTLMTDAIRWNQETEILSSEDEVIMKKGDSTITGRGFELFPRLEIFRIYNVQGTIHRGDVDL